MGTKKLTAIPTVSLCGPDVAYAPFGLEEVIKFNFLTSLRKLWAILDLNRGPKDYESSALTAELMAQGCTQKYIVTDNILEFFLVNGIKV